MPNVLHYRDPYNVYLAKISTKHNVKKYKTPKTTRPMHLSWVTSCSNHSSK